MYLMTFELLNTTEPKNLEMTPWHVVDDTCWTVSLRSTYRAACLFSCLVFPPTFGSIITLNGPCSPHVASHNPLLMSASSPAVIWPVFHLALIVILSSWRMWTDLMCFFFLFPQGFHQFLLNSWIYFIDLYGYSVLIYSVSVYYGFLKRFVMIP